MSDITVINDSEQSSLVTNGLAKNGELYLKAAGSTDAGAIVVYDSGVWRTFANEASAGFANQYSVDFDGTNDYLSLGNLGSAGRSLGAMLMWVDVTSTNGIHSNNDIGFLMGFGGTGGGLHWGYWGTNTDLLTFSFHNFSRRTRFNAPSAGDKLTAGWHLIGVNHNGTSYDIIIDGVIATSVTLNSGSTGSYSIQTATSILSGTGFDSVAVMTNTAANYATEGLVDEVAIWDSALSSSDITDIYNSGTPVDLTSYSPNGWWRMGDNDGGTGTTITDQGSGGNDGTLTNGPTFSTTVPS